MCCWNYGNCGAHALWEIRRGAIHTWKYGSHGTQARLETAVVMRTRLRELPHVRPVVFWGAEGPKTRQVFSSELLWDVRGGGWRLGKGTLHTTPMACYDLCRPCGPTPLANSCNEPCALQCQDSRVIINPSPVLVTLPGPIMTSFPQSTAVGSTSSAAVGTELNAQGQPISGGFGYGFGYGRGFGYGLGGLGCYGRRGGYIC
uniref:Keratin n=2 Tax=Ficedula albicollis TaxID=59894 RepID=A0A803W627_FICAL